MTKLVTTAAALLFFISAYAQDEELGNLDIDELAAVDVEKLSLPITADSARALSGETINIGILLPISKISKFSEEMIMAAQMAIDEINASGKILGKELYLIPADDATDVYVTMNKAEELITKYHIAGLIGPNMSSSYIKLVNEILPQHPTVIISPAATSNEITDLEDQDLAFRTAASDALQGKTAAIFSTHNLEKKTASIFYIDDVYGSGLAQEFKHNFLETGGTSVEERRYSPLINVKYYDLIPRLADLLKSRPDVLYLISTIPDIINISHQIDSAQLFKSYKPILIGSDAIRSDQVSEKASTKVLEGMFGTSLKVNRDTYFAHRFKKRYGFSPVSEETADAYDITYLFALAIMEAQSTDPIKVAQHIRSVSGSGKKVTAEDLMEIRAMIRKGEDINYEGLNSSLDFDPHGDVIDRQYDIWQIENGQFKHNAAEIEIK